MARFVRHTTKVEATAVLELNEDEIAAIDALTGYGVGSFLDTFYTKLGKAYMEPHEAGLRSFFEGVKGASGIVAQARAARKLLLDHAKERT
jgi:hypothetical protein